MEEWAYVFIFFPGDKLQKQPKCPSVDKWIKQLWDIYTMEYYSTVKKINKILLCNSMDGPGEQHAK